MIPNYRLVQYIFRNIFFGVPRKMTSQRNLNEPDFFLIKRKISLTNTWAEIEFSTATSMLDTN